MKLLYLLFTPCGESGAGRTKRVIQYFATMWVVEEIIRRMQALER